MSSVSKLYLRHIFATIDGTPPALVTLSATTPTIAVTNEDLLTQTLSPDISPDLQEYGYITTSATKSAQTHFWYRFFSAPMAAQTISAQSVSVHFGARQANTNVNLHAARGVLAVWRPSDGSLVGRLWDTADLAALAANTNEQAMSGSATTSSISVLAGDILVFEIWTMASQSKATAYSITAYWDGTTEDSASNNAAYIAFANPIDFPSSPTSPAIAPSTVVYNPAVTNRPAVVPKLIPPIGGDGGTVVARDTFNRSNGSAWGTADQGGTWALGYQWGPTGGGGAYSTHWSVAGGVGSMYPSFDNSSTGSASVWGWQRLSAQGTNGNAVVTGKVYVPRLDADPAECDGPAASRSAGLGFRANVTAEWQGGFVAHVGAPDSGQAACGILAADNQYGGFTNVATGFNVSMPSGAAGWVRIKLEVAYYSATRLRAKFWRDGDPEPSDWSLTGWYTTAVLQSDAGYGPVAYHSWGSNINTIGPCNAATLQFADVTMWNNIGPSVYSPSVEHVAIPPQDLYPDLLDGSSAVYAPTLTQGPAIVSLSLLDGGAVAYSPIVVPDQLVSLALLDGGATVYAIIAGAEQTIGLDLLDGSRAVYDASVLVSQLIDLGLLDGGATLYAVSLTGEVLISLPALDGSAAIFSLTLSSATTQDLALVLLSGATELYVMVAALVSPNDTSTYYGDDGRYIGQAKAIHVIQDSFSATPVGPADSEIAKYLGSSPKIETNPGSPSQWDSASIVGPVRGEPTYRGVSQAVHVFGQDTYPWTPPDPIPPCWCADEAPGGALVTRYYLPNLFADSVFYTSYDRVVGPSDEGPTSAGFDEWWWDGLDSPPSPYIPLGASHPTMLGAFYENSENFNLGNPRTNGLALATRFWKIPLDANTYRVVFHSDLLSDFYGSASDDIAHANLTVYNDFEWRAGTWTGTPGRPGEFGTVFASSTTHRQEPPPATPSGLTDDVVEFDVPFTPGDDFVGLWPWWTPGSEPFRPEQIADLATYFNDPWQAFWAIYADAVLDEDKPRGLASFDNGSGGWLGAWIDVYSNTCTECEDPNNPGYSYDNFTPGYLPIFRRQIGDPQTQLDAWLCNMESGAMVLDWHTRSAIQVWGGDLVQHCGRSEASIVGSGTNLTDVKTAWAYYGQYLDVRSGQTWADAMTCLSQGRALILNGDYGEFTLAESCQDDYVDNHAVSVYPYIVSDRILVGDPICQDFKGIKQSSLQAYAEAFGVAVFGVTSPQKIVFAVSRPWTP